MAAMVNRVGLQQRELAQVGQDGDAYFFMLALDEQTARVSCQVIFLIPCTRIECTLSINLFETMIPPTDKHSHTGMDRANKPSRHQYQSSKMSAS